MTVHSEVERGSCFEFSLVVEVSRVAPDSVGPAPRSLVLPEPSLSMSLGRTITAVEEVAQETSGKLTTSLTNTPTQTPAAALPPAPLPSTTLHGFTADECAQLRRVRVLHLGEHTPTTRSWKRVADFYGIRVDFCSTVAEVRAILLAQLNDVAATAAADASADGKGGDHQGNYQLPTLTVDLDLGVSEQECASQLYTLAPTRVMYLTSSKKGKVDLFSDSDEPVSSTPVIVPSSPTVGAQSGPASQQQQQQQQGAGGMAAPFTGAAVKHQAHYPCLRRRLMKPIKVRTLIRQTLELTLEPMPSAAWTASPLSAEGGDMEAGGWTPPRDELDAAASRSRTMSVSSASSTGYWSPSVPLTPSNGGSTPMYFSTPPTSSTTNKRAPKIINIAQQFPLRSALTNQRLRARTRSGRAANSQSAECFDDVILTGCNFICVTDVPVRPESC